MPHRFSFYKTRLAPTPSGYLHVGNALNFLLTSALAKKSGANVLLRIDDLDRERYRSAYAEDVFETLHFLSIDWNEGPRDVGEFETIWSQRHRMNLYRAALDRLRQKEVVFACVCSRKQSDVCNCQEKTLPLDAPDASWRLVTDENVIAVKDIYGKTKTTTLPAEMKNFVVRKKDGLPAYQLSSLVDDLHFGIDLIVRGEDLWPSTLAQHFLATQLGESRFASVSFFHHPLLTDNGKKLSKSAGAASVKNWRESGRDLTQFIQRLEELIEHPSPLKNAEELLELFVP